jgi:hypothetical protein
MKKLLFASILLALISSAFVSTNTRTITGTIKDQNGDPVPFATSSRERNTSIGRSGRERKFQNDN